MKALKLSYLEFGRSAAKPREMYELKEDSVGNFAPVSN